MEGNASTGGQRPYYRYVDQDGFAIAEGTQLELDSFGIPVVIDIHPVGSAGHPEVTLRREDDNRDRMIGYEYVLKSEDGSAMTFAGEVEWLTKTNKRRRTNLPRKT